MLLPATTNSNDIRLMEKAKIITTRVKLKYQYLLRARAVDVMAVFGCQHCQ